MDMLTALPPKAISARSHRIRRRLTNLAVTAALAVVCYYFVAPVLWLVLGSTKTQEEVFSSSPLWFGSTFRLWDNVTHVLNYNNSIFLTWTKNSLLYTIPSVAITIISSASAGFGLAKYRFRGRTLLLFIT